jgi:hypothetical protein
LKSLKILGLENTKVYFNVFETFNYSQFNECDFVLTEQITTLDVLSGLDHLESLNISYTKVSNNSMMSLIGYPSLVSLNILSTSIDDIGLRHLHGNYQTNLTIYII